MAQTGENAILKTRLELFIDATEFGFMEHEWRMEKAPNRMVKESLHFRTFHHDSQLVTRPFHLNSASDRADAENALIEELFTLDWTMVQIQKLNLAKATYHIPPFYGPERLNQLFLERLYSMYDHFNGEPGYPPLWLEPFAKTVYQMEPIFEELQLGSFMASMPTTPTKKEQAWYLESLGFGHRVVPYDLRGALRHFHRRMTQAIQLIEGHPDFPYKIVYPGFGKMLRLTKRLGKMMVCDICHDTIVQNNWQNPFFHPMEALLNSYGFVVFSRRFLYTF